MPCDRYAKHSDLEETGQSPATIQYPDHFFVVLIDSLKAS